VGEGRIKKRKPKIKAEVRLTSHFLILWAGNWSMNLTAVLV
jgi:hypothetical protein